MASHPLLVVGFLMAFSWVEGTLLLPGIFCLIRYRYGAELFSIGEPVGFGWWFYPAWSIWPLLVSSGWFRFVFATNAQLASAMSTRYLAISNQGVSLSLGQSALLPALALSQSLNALVSILIIVRLLLHRRKVTKSLGRSHAQQYVSIIAVIVESASLTSSVGFTYLILYGIKHPLQNVFLQALDQIQVREILILRNQCLSHPSCVVHFPFVDHSQS